MSKGPDLGNKVLSPGFNIQNGRGVALDGIISRGSYENIFATKPSPRQSRETARSAQKMHLSLKKSVTLMRQTIPKPKDIATVKADIKRPFYPLKSQTTRRVKFASVSLTRLERAKEIARDSKINRFGSSMAPLPRAITRPFKPAFNKMSTKVATVPRPVPKNFKANNSTVLAATYTSPVLARKRPVNSERLEAMLDKALHQADSHRDLLKAHQKNSILARISGRWKIMSIFVALIAGLGGGTLAYYKVPAVAIKIASLRAGVSATSPSYVPPGFSLSQTAFKDGAVTFKYTADSGNLVLTEKKSELNSQSLRDNLLANRNQVYQTTQYNGVTIYTYHPLVGAVAQSSAAAVSGGVLMAATNHSTTSNDDLVKLLQSVVTRP